MPDVPDFILKLQRRRIEGSHATARQTAELLRSVVSQHRMPHTNQTASLLEAVRAVGEQLIAANPVELAVGNIVRRVLHIIREEDSSAVSFEGLQITEKSDDEEDVERKGGPLLSAAAVAAASRSTLRPRSLQTLLEDGPAPIAPSNSSSNGDSEGRSKSDKSARSKRLKHAVIEAINLLIEEINSCYDDISEQAVEHIHHNEVILTLGRSKTVKEFLYAAKQKNRSFRVFVAEGAPRFMTLHPFTEYNHHLTTFRQSKDPPKPSVWDNLVNDLNRYQGHVLAKELIQKGLETTVITDSAIFAMISRVNMVIVGAHAIMANGGVIAPVGMNMLALAAQRHAVPFVVVAGSHKLCPLYSHNPEVLLNELKSPSDLIDFGEFSDCMDFGVRGGAPLMHVVNPTFDYVPPKLVSLFITDTGGHNASHMYKLIADYYSADDLVIKKTTTS